MPSSGMHVGGGVPYPPVIITTSIPSATQGIAYSTQLAAINGFPPYSWSLLFGPPWMQCSAAGVLSGTPTSSGQTSVSVIVRDTKSGSSSSVGFALNVNVSLNITSTSPLPGATAGTAYNFTFAASGGMPPYTWIAISGLPSWATLSPSGVMTGTPPSASTDTIVVQVQDSSTPVKLATQSSFSLAVTGGVQPNAPAAMFRGYIQSTSALISWVPPASGTPDSYNLYRNGVKINASPLLPSNYGTTTLWYNDVGLAPSGHNIYNATAVLAGVESAFSPSLGITTLRGAPGSTTPTAPTTFTPAPFVLPNPATVTTWNATVLDNSLTAGTGTPGPGHTVQGCSLQYALNNASYGDAIWLTGGATYTGGVGGVNGFTVPAALKTLNGVPSGLAGPYLFVLPTTYASLPAHGTRVAPTDIPNMATIAVDVHANSGIGMTLGSSDHIYLMGLAYVPTANDTNNDLFYGLTMSFQTSFAQGSVAPCSYINIDRCYVGNNSQNANFSHLRHGVGISGNFINIDSCYLEGFFDGPTVVGPGGTDANALLIAGGGPGIVNNTYFQAASESVLFSGVYCPQNLIPHDWVFTNFVSEKLAQWQVGTAPQGCIGDWAKNHIEFKCGTRCSFGPAHCINNWNGFAGSQHGRLAVVGAVDSAGSVWPANNQWNFCSDILFHDIQGDNIGSLGYVFQSVSSATGYGERVMFENCVLNVNPAPGQPGGGRGGPNQYYGLQISQLVPDVIVDHCTIIVNGANTNIQNASTIPAVAYLQPGTVSGGNLGVPAAFALLDHLTVSNCVLDGVKAYSYFNQGGGFVGTSGTTGLNQSCINYTWTNNVPVTDTSVFPTGNFAPPAGGYSGLGMKNFISNATPPTYGNGDWNIVTGQFASASSTSGPLGAFLGPPPSAAPFPLVGGVLVGPVDYSSLANINKLSVAVISNFPGFSEGGKNLQQQVAALKAANAGMKVFSYHDIMEFATTAGTNVNSAFHQAYLSHAAASWFLWPNYTTRGTWSGTGPWVGNAPVLRADGQYAVNIMTPSSNTSSPTDPILPNATFPNWWAAFVKSWSTAVAPNLDGTFTDNMDFQSSDSGDWQQNGTSQTPSSQAQAWRNAYAAYDAASRTALGPAYLHVGNVATWGNGGAANLVGYQQLLDGGIYELAIPNQEQDSNGGWLNMMTRYALIMQAMKTPNYVIFQQHNVSPTAYAAMRYGFCSCLLDNAYYCYDVDSSSVPLFDEMVFALGLPIGGPNNFSNGTYSSGALTKWQNGVWRRDFQFGIILVNPRGNGAQTVTLETTYWHLRGTQDPVTNNAQPVTSVTMPDPGIAATGGSGLFLSRTAT